MSWIVLPPTGFWRTAVFLVDDETSGGAAITESKKIQIPVVVMVGNLTNRPLLFDASLALLFLTCPPTVASSSAIVFFTNTEVRKMCLH